MDKSHFKRHKRAYLLTGGILCLIVLSIWINSSVPAIGKAILTILFAGIVLTFAAFAYRDMVKNYEKMPDPPIATKQLANIPPMPAHPPLSAKEPKTPTPLYDHRPRPIPAIGYSLMAGGGLVVLCFVGASMQPDVMWAIAILYGATAVAFCYWQWIKWRGRWLIVTEGRKELQSALPWPFATHVYSMPNTAGAAQDIERTFLDRLFGTCRLFSDIKAKGDEVFHDLKWLPYPDKLGQALKQQPIRRNSWWPVQRKDS